MNPEPLTCRRLPPRVREKLRKTLALLASDKVHERAAAMAGTARVLGANGLDWPDLADAIVKMPRRARTTAHVRPGTVQGDLANLPKALDALKPLRRWVSWSWEWRVNKSGNGKWTKPLLRPDKPRSYAKSDDPTTWGTYEQALVAYKAGLCDGIGFCLLGIDIGAFDLDKCRDPITGAIAPEAMAIVERASSYTEITVSGTGLRVVGIGTGKPLQVKQKLPDCGVEVESYRNCARYITVSGNVLPGAPVAMVDIGSVLEAVVAELGHVQRADVAFDLPPDDTPFPDGTISTSQALIDDAGRLALRAVSPSIVTDAARPAQPAAVERQRDAMVPQGRVQSLHPRGQGRLLVQPLGKRRRRHDQADHARAELLVRRGAGITPRRSSTASGRCCGSARRPRTRPRTKRAPRRR